MSEITIKKPIFPEEKDAFPWNENALKSFKNLINDEGLKCRMDDIFLLGFLRSRKFDLQRALQQLKNYYNVRINYSQYFKNLLPSKLEHALKLDMIGFFPKPNQDGCYMYIFKFGKWDTSIVNSYDILRILMMVMDFQLNFHRTQVKKIIMIVDSAGLSLSHFLYFSPRTISNMATFIFKDFYPMRFSAIHYVNMNIIIRAMVTVLYPILPAKLRKRLHFHSDMKSLHKFIEPEYLPIEYEGTLNSSQISEYNNMIRENEELFRMNEEYVNLYDEEKKRHFNQGRFKYINEDIEDENMRKFVEKSEETFKTYSKDPEGFIAALKQDSAIDITYF